MADIGTGLAEHDGGLRLVEPQQVEDRMFLVARRHRQGAIFDVDMLARLALRHDAQGIALKGAGQLFDFPRHRGRKHQRAAFGRGSAQNEFQILGKAQIQHLVRLVQNRGLQARQIQRAAFNMIAQTARRADHDMRAAFQRALFVAVIHATDAGRHLRPRRSVQPFQLSLDLQGQFARRRHDQRHRAVRIKQPR